MRRISRTLPGFVLAVTVLWGPPPGRAQEHPSGTVTMAIMSLALGVGAHWGEGTLTFPDGRHYTFTLRGREVVGLGMAQVQVTGKVYSLHHVAAFEGLYAAGKAGAAVGSGREPAALRNQHGVVIILDATPQSAQLALATSGVELTLSR